MGDLQMIARGTVLLTLLAVAGCGLSHEGPGIEGPARRSAYHSPLDVAFSPDGNLLAVSDHTAQALVIVDASTGRVTGQTHLRGRSAGVAWSADGRAVYVAEHTAGTVARVELSGKIARRFRVGARPVGLALARGRGRLLVADSATRAVSIVDLSSGKEIARVDVVREPWYIAITPDESLAVVGNRLPAGDASDPSASAAVSLISLESNRTVATIALPPNSVNVLGVAVSPDGKWAYAAHNLGRAALPTEQIEYGWINANAVSVIDLRTRRHHATVLLDQPTAGAANPWGLAISPDGQTLWVALSGIHKLGRLNLTKLHAWLDRQLPRLAGRSEDDGLVRGAPVNVGASPPAGKMPGQVELVTSRMPAAYGTGVYLADVFGWSQLGGNGPRGLAISPDGGRLAAAMYFSGGVAVVDARTRKVSRSVALGRQPPADAARRGEAIFHDATRSYQQWLSCSTCHPSGRSDGLNWDLLNDGIGSPKNTRSLVLSHRTPPVMWEGVRPSMEVAVAAGFRFSLFQKAPKEDLEAVRAYIRSLRPLPSPHLVAERLSQKARRGRRIFDDPRTGCGQCHPTPLLTDLKTHDVGTRVKTDRTGTFDTPALVELWRTAPYLHHGRSRTLREIFTKFNQGDRHGKTSHLSPDEIDALVEYMKSL